MTSEALITETPHQRREWVKWLAPASEPMWSLAVPFDDGELRVLAVLRRAPRFTYTETARLRALLGLLTPTGKRQETDVVGVASR